MAGKTVQIYSISVTTERCVWRTAGISPEKIQEIILSLPPLPCGAWWRGVYMFVGGESPR